MGITFRGSLEEGQGSAAPGVGQMRNPDAGLVKEVLSASHLGCQSSSRLRTLTVNLTGLLRGDTFRQKERSNKSGQHIAGVGIGCFDEGHTCTAAVGQVGWGGWC